MSAIEGHEAEEEEERKRRMRTSGNPRVTNDVRRSPPPKIPLDGPLQRFTSTEGPASLEYNRLKTLKHAKTLFSVSQRHG
eukprot:3252153-Pyramimonas_sp.AAC.1